MQRLLAPALPAGRSLEEQDATMLFKFLLILLSLGFVFGQIISLNFGFVRISLLDIAVLALVLASMAQQRFKLPSVRLYILIFAPFLLAAIISLVFQFPRLTLQEISVSSLYLWRFLLYLLLLPVFVTLPEKTKKTALNFLWTSGLFVAILGILQYFLYPNLRNLSYLGWDPHEFRLFSTFLDPNFTAIVLALTLILGMYLKDHLRRSWLIIGEIIVFTALLLTYSRGGYLALIVAAGVIAFAKKRLSLFMLFIGTLAIILMVLPKPGGEGVNLLRTISIGARFENNAEALNLFSKNPIFGVGFDTLRFTRAVADDTDQSLLHSLAGFHNSWLFVLATTGIVGFLSYIWLWFSVLKTTIVRNSLKKYLHRHWIVVVSVLAVFIHSQFDNSLFYPQVMVWLWVLIGSLLFKENTSL